jgi:hypothetical protein
VAWSIISTSRTRRLSPFDPLAFGNALGTALVHFAAHRFEQAIEWADRALHDQPRFTTAMRVSPTSRIGLRGRRFSRRGRKASN